MRIAIDLDGVCYNFTRALSEYIEHMTGERYYAVPSCWEFYATDWGMSLAEYLQWFEEGVDAGWIFTIGEPAPGCIEALTALRADGHTIHLCTERNIGRLAKVNTAEWLEAVGMPYDSLTFVTGDKSETLIADIAIDDRPRNVDQWTDAGVKAYCMGFDEREDMRDHPFYMPYDWDNFRCIVNEAEYLRTPLDGFDPDEDYSYADCPTFRLGDGYTVTLDAAKEIRVTDPDTGGQKGSKLARFDLIPPRPLWKLAEHYGRGAAKYAERNWELGYSFSLSFAAMQRHAWAFWNKAEINGEAYEGDDYHLSAIAFHAFALQEYTQTHPEKDGRKGQVS